MRLHEPRDRSVFRHSPSAIRQPISYHRAFRIHTIWSTRIKQHMYIAVSDVDTRSPKRMLQISPPAYIHTYHPMNQPTNQPKTHPSALENPPAVSKAHVSPPINHSHPVKPPLTTPIRAFPPLPPSNIVQPKKGVKPSPPYLCTANTPQSTSQAPNKNPTNQSPSLPNPKPHTPT